MENTVFQKQNSKKYALMAFGSGGLKMVFTLLTEFIIFYVQVIIIKIRISGF